MVQRSGFYVKDGKIIQRIIWIAWDLGFDKQAKHQYIDRVINALGTDIAPIADVTSASYIPETRNLSPIFVKMQDGNQSVEEFLQHMKESIFPQVFQVPGVSDYVYLKALSEENVKTALSYNCYVDVFHNPQKSYGNSQALSLAVLRLIWETKQFHVLELEMNDFIKWYNTIEMQLEYLED